MPVDKEKNRFYPEDKIKTVMAFGGQPKPVADCQRRHGVHLSFRHRAADRHCTIALVRWFTTAAPLVLTIKYVTVRTEIPTRRLHVPYDRVGRAHK